MFAAMNKRNGVSLTSTIADTYDKARAKALDFGLDMNVWVIVRC